MNEVTHSQTYTGLRNRFTNGHEFLISVAIEHINRFAVNQEITADEASELDALARQNGVEVLSDDYKGKVDSMAQNVSDLNEVVSEMIGGGM